MLLYDFFEDPNELVLKTGRDRGGNRSLSVSSEPSDYLILLEADLAPQYEENSVDACVSVRFY